MIPATKKLFLNTPIASKRKRRVAGYARVSTDTDEQFTSYQAQLDYYRDFIQKNEEWEFVGIYADEGISGTSIKRRAGFNKMIEDALAGKIDLIVTKSVSRFARNTVDCLVTIRKLKDAGCECFFEKENIFTFDSKGEVLLTIMSSLAQDESRSISENVQWGVQKRFSDGKVSLAYKRFLGYERGPNGFPIINPEEAETVRNIYKMYMKGMTPTAIAKELTAKGVKTPAGKDVWGSTVITSILRNEKYKGDALLQKRYTVDFLTKETRVNTGEVPQYYVHGSHPAIIDPEEWDVVQGEIERRKKIGRSYSNQSVFATKLVCSDCGDYFGQKVWHSTDRYRREIWRSNHKFDNDSKCTTPHLVAEQIQQMFLLAYNQLMVGDTHVIEDCIFLRATLQDFSEFDRQIREVDEKMDITRALMTVCVQENAATVQAQDEYNEKYAALVKRLEEETKEKSAIQKQKDLRKAKISELNKFIQALKNNGSFVNQWDDELWCALIEKAIVYPNSSITFVFKDGREIIVEMPKG